MTSLPNMQKAGAPCVAPAFPYLGSEEPVLPA